METKPRGPVSSFRTSAAGPATQPSRVPVIAGWGLSGLLLIGVAIGGWEYSKLKTTYEGVVQERDAGKAELIKQQGELARLQEQLKTKQASDALTPAAFGYYVVRSGQLVRMQTPGRWQDNNVLDAPTVNVPRAPSIHIVIYDRQQAAFATPKMFVKFLAKVEGTSAWHIRDFGYEVVVAPRADNRDILDLRLSYPSSGRYILGGGGGIWYTFNVEGEVNDPEHCVRKDGWTYKRCS